MRLPICRREPLFTDVRVTLRCCDVGMTKEFLNRPQIGPAIEEVGCIRVA
jgi:hypothetical protein